MEDEDWLYIEELITNNFYLQVCKYDDVNKLLDFKKRLEKNNNFSYTIHLYYRYNGKKYISTIEQISNIFDIIEKYTFNILQLFEVDGLSDEVFNKLMKRLQKCGENGNYKMLYISHFHSKFDSNIVEKMYNYLNNIKTNITFEFTDTTISTITFPKFL